MDITATIIDSAPLIIPLIAGYLLDLLIGDPHNLPHPIKLFGNLISMADKFLNKGSFRFLKGVFSAIFLVSVTWTILFFCFSLISSQSAIYYPIASIMLFFGLANKSLIDEARQVDKKLCLNGIEAGRKQLSFIVGRDTSQLTSNQIRTAVLETLSENLSDGVVAPLFYYAIGGIPLMFAYKMINTLDSMVGYKSEKYFYFGKFAARLDDIANFIPARITALIMVTITLSKRGFIYLFRYSSKHSSPNSGWPEAALAGILNCRFGGANTYHGIVVNKPYIGDNYREINPYDLQKSYFINHLVTITAIVLILVSRL